MKNFIVLISIFLGSHALAAASPSIDQDDVPQPANELVARVSFDEPDVQAPSMFPTVFDLTDDAEASKAAVPPQFDPHYEGPSYKTFYAFRLQSDYPNYNTGVPNNGIPVAHGGAIPRDFAGYGLEVRNLNGGGCFTVSPDSIDCLKETSAAGTEYTVLKRRERWTVRYMYTDSGTGKETLLKDSTVGWTTLPNGTTCMEPYLFGCSLTGYSVNDLPQWMSGAPISCALSLGAGYKVQMYYQYSRYRGDEPIPTFAVEWVPATVPATATTLNQPGKLQFWYHNWELHPGENALRARFEQARINPSVPFRHPDTKDLTVTTVGGTKTDRIDAGTTKVIVEASECGIPYRNVSFTGTATFVNDSGGHVHNLTGAVNTPPNGTIVTIPALSGTTDADGRWESATVTAGEYGGQYEMTVKSADLKIDPAKPWPATAKPSRLTVGFRGLQPLSEICRTPLIGSYLCTLIKPVGQNNQTECASQKCDNHKDLSQFGHRKLLLFIVKMVYLYRKDVDSNAVLPINDMSLPAGGMFDFNGDWGTREHITHRIGVDVDINASTTVNGQKITIDEAALTKIVEEKLQGSFIHESSIHYRLPAAEIDIVVGEVK